MSTTSSPPEELLHDPDRGVFAGLVVPFAEAPDPLHPHARRFSWGDLKMPRTAVPVNVDHAGEAVGVAAGWLQTRQGIFASLKVGRTAQSLIRGGHAGLSVESDDGQIVGVALVSGAGTPMFSTARLFTEGAVLDSPEALRFGLDPVTGMLKFWAPPAAPSPAGHPAVDLGAHRRSLASFSMAAVRDEVARARARFRRRREELAQEPLEREEQGLIARGVPVQFWPAHLPGRTRWDALEAAQAAQARQAATSAWAQLLAFQAAAASTPPPRRRWWRRIGRRR